MLSRAFMRLQTVAMAKPVRLAPPDHLPRRGLGQPGENAQKRGFAGAIRTAQDNGLARLCGQGNIPKQHPRPAHHAEPRG